MEVTCPRCHQAIQPETCFCPTCGLPQLVYNGEAAETQAVTERWTAAAHDASMVEWRPAIRSALALALPAGLICSTASPLGSLGMIWMGAAAAWAVTLYMRRQKPAWITMGAGARIGLITGIFAAWLAFAAGGATLFVQRNMLHQAAQMDADWKNRVTASQEMAQAWTTSMGPSEASEAQAIRKKVMDWMLSPWGRAGIEAFGLSFNSALLLLFAAAGGALGARVMAHKRRPEV
ncbi:MAG: zinc ribbon domain-containing protein [Acidobacteriota bacterium]|nr:zinc ribbon domain-containing protein [Acidobacteriota bacterium]MDE3162631.1 zinc ribbon domain-containing protein [Acidobacteriota bacterium]